MSPPLPRGRARKPAVRFWTLRLAVLALVLAPVLANLWPALGRGPMLYAGEPNAEHAHAGADSPRQEDGAGAPARHHAGGSGAHRHGDGAASDPDASAIDHGDGRSDAAAGGHADHATHCALCVLAALAWAPQVHLDTDYGHPPPARRALPPPSIAPRANGCASRVHARAPPTLS